MHVRPVRGAQHASVGRSGLASLLIAMGAATILGTAVLGQAPASQPGASASPQPGASPSGTLGPAMPDPLVEGLLQAADLPPGLLPVSDVQDGTDYDIDEAAFGANDGTRIVSRTWGMASPAGASIVFDIRLQFPTPEAASAYLAAALPTLSERDTTGLQPLSTPAEAPLGDEGHVFGLDTQGDSGTVSIRDYIFRVGPVVAKVLSGGSDISAERSDAIAQAAAARMTAAGTPVPGSPRPRPSPAGTSSPPPPSLPSGDLESLLLAHIPETIAPTCSPDPQRLWEGELVTLVCAPEDADVEVTYSGFDTADHMGAAYQTSLDTIDLSDTAASCDLGTFTGAYQVDGQDVGQVTCWSEPNGRAIMWSDDRLQILSVAVSRSLDSAGLYLWWLDAGPVP